MAKVTLAVDPHKWKMAGALFYDKRLVDVFFSESKEESLNRRIKELLKPFPAIVDELVVEKMVWYPDTKNSRPMDLLDVNTSALYFAGHFDCKLTLVPPRHWKGQVPKDISQKRIVTKLDKVERTLLRGFPVAVLRDIRDAIGIGFWSVGR